MFSDDLPERVSTGVSGLDTVLGGGLAGGCVYLVEGTPGTGKTTLALQFLRAGAARGETGLYITLSETETELRAVARSHGWTLEGLAIHELSDGTLAPDDRQSVLLPSEIELGETIERVRDVIVRMSPARVVFDSLSEMRLLADEPLRYRRQILALKQFLCERRCTTLLLDDKATSQGDAQLHSIVHGVISLHQVAQEFGIERRHLRVIKMRGMKFQGGAHDLVLDTGGLRVFPRLVAAEHRTEQVFSPPRTTGTPALDELLGGGLSPGTNTLILGPSGIGKTTTAVSCVLAALERGEPATYFLFDEGVSTLVNRSARLGLDLQPHIDSGALQLVQVDPAELSPGEFASRTVDAVRRHRSRFLVIDSLNAYLLAMPGQPHLLLHVHELLSFLNHQDVTTVMLMGQHGLVGEVRSDVDLSYLSDVILTLRFFEAGGEIRSAVTCVKSRVAAHERQIRELKLGPRGLNVGQRLADFEGILSGLPHYRGGTPMFDRPNPPGVA